MVDGLWRRDAECVEQRAIDSSPDLRTAALRFAQSRSQRATVAAQRGPEINASDSASRQRQAKRRQHAHDRRPGGRLEPCRTAGQAVHPVSSWFRRLVGAGLVGRVRRSVEAADADVAQQAAPCST